ncbi:MAG: OsmC family protein [Candidatus Bipolaricaulia bacterium]
MANPSVEIQQIGDTPTSQGIARDHRVLIDRPEAKGGHDRGPIGGEMLLLALGGCFMSNLIEAANARDLQVDDMRVVVHGEMGGNPTVFQSATMEVYGDPADEALFGKVIEIAERACINTNTLKGCIEIDVRRQTAASAAV